LTVAQSQTSKEAQKHGYCIDFKKIEDHDSLVGAKAETGSSLDF
jgi:hypothetical protein